MMLIQASPWCFSSCSCSQSVFFSRYSMQYMRPPFGPSLKASIASSNVIRSLISTSYANGGESFAGSRLNVAIGLWTATHVMLEYSSNSLR